MVVMLPGGSTRTALPDCLSAEMEPCASVRGRPRKFARGEVWEEDPKERWLDMVFCFQMFVLLCDGRLAIALKRRARTGALVQDEEGGR